MSDTKKFRNALSRAGFGGCSKCSIFNDKGKNFRRLKLWFAEAVNKAPQKQQRRLEKLLREAFGDRILCMYFLPGYARWAPAASLCIRLKD